MTNAVRHANSQDVIDMGGAGIDDDLYSSPRAATRDGEPNHSVSSGLTPAVDWTRREFLTGFANESVAPKGDAASGPRNRTAPEPAV